MAKSKRFYYKCILVCDLGWYGPDQRKERWETKGKVSIQPTKTLHSIRLKPSGGYNARGEEMPPDYIVTDKPVGKCFTEQVPKKVSRPSWDPNTGRRNGRVYRKKFSVPKLEILDPDEIDSLIRKRAFDLPWTDNLYSDGPEKVDLPGNVAVMDKTALRGEGDEPEERVSDGEEA